MAAVTTVFTHSTLSSPTVDREKDNTAECITAFATSALDRKPALCLAPIQADSYVCRGIQSINASALLFEKWLNELPLEIKGCCVKQALDTLGPNSKQYLCAIKILLKTDPDIKKFINFPEEKFDENIPTLTRDSIKIILDYLIKKRSLPEDIKISFAERKGMDASADLELSEQIREWTQSSARDTYIIHLSGSHYSLFYLTKTESGIDLFQLDPLGGGNLATLQACLDIFKESNTVLHAYVSYPTRQKSDSGCSVFVIRDIVAISKTRSILMAIAKNPTYQMKHLQMPKEVIYFTEFPPEMKKSTQSLSELKTYAKRSQNPEVCTTKSVVKSIDSDGNPETGIIKTARKLIDFESFIEVHSKRNPKTKKLQNEYIRYRRFKYANIAIKHFFETRV